MPVWLVAILAAAPLEGAALTELLRSDGATNYEKVVDYDLSARLDPASKIIDGRGKIVWTNRSPVPVTELWWHLYLNAFANDRSTFLIESDGGQLRGDVFERGHWGWVRVDALSANGEDLASVGEFRQPDDPNADDRTVWVTPLKTPVAPGGSIELDIRFTSKLPKVFARSGWGGSFLMVAQWFPKLGVLEWTNTPTASATWNCHQYHANSEFFADYGRFRVAMTVPADHELGATGVRVSTQKNDDGTVTFVHEQQRVHDFAWAVDPRFVREVRTFDAAAEVSPAEAREVADLLGLSPESIALSNVEVTLLVQPEHVDSTERYFAATFAALKWFGLWYGAYPYPTLTVIDPPRAASGAGGMEYPTLFTGGARWAIPPRMPVPESVTIHEFGHQYWYGLVGTNEFEEAWLDEGFNTFSTGMVLEKAFGDVVLAPSLFGWPLAAWFHQSHRIVDFQRLRFLLSPSDDAVLRRAWEYRDRISYSINSYPRPALALRELRRELGPSVFAKTMRAYHLSQRYRHPRSEDFFEIAAAISGRDLEPFFSRTILRSGGIDNAVGRFSGAAIPTAAGVFSDRSGAEEVTVDEAEALGDTDLFRTRISIERKGEIAHPVDVEVRFADGSTLGRAWDGEYSHSQIELVSRSRATSVQLYPRGSPFIELDTLNDSRRVEADRRPAFAWGGHLSSALQALLFFLGALL